ncbi:hypothetical protein N656DRAFT_162899 [Canariomyces notabilis]|uniref:Uncharacterized protein n=1 Tax=Canariomyces notabilis TaxID=2074819 RepID=A0AAN6TBT1_9PEZI|nr:hypothetical protein N656DRAFT_162899 [Canariomyces arenarius]
MTRGRSKTLRIVSRDRHTGLSRTLRAQLLEHPRFRAKLEQAEREIRGAMERSRQTAGSSIGDDDAAESQQTTKSTEPEDKEMDRRSDTDQADDDPDPLVLRVGCFVRKRPPPKRGLRRGAGEARVASGLADRPQPSGSAAQGQGEEAQSSPEGGGMMLLLESLLPRRVSVMRMYSTSTYAETTGNQFGGLSVQIPQLLHNQNGDTSGFITATFWGWNP